MQCISPITIKDKGQQIAVPCNRCNFCLRNRQFAWAFRLQEHLKGASSGIFLTLTYNPGHLPVKSYHGHYNVATLEKEHLHGYHKIVKQWQTRYIKKQGKKNNKGTAWTKDELKKWEIKYYSVGEYGTKSGRPHYHSIIFNIHPATRKQLARLWAEDQIPRGHVHGGNVTESSIMYVTKYLIDKTDQDWLGIQKPFTAMSKGLGARYLIKHSAWHINAKMKPDEYRMYVMRGKFKMSMPRYYKERLFKIHHDPHAYNIHDRKPQKRKTSFGRLWECYLKPKQEREAMQRLHQQLQRLYDKGYKDPYQEYEARRNEHHENIKTKSKKLNTL